MNLVIVIQSCTKTSVVAPPIMIILMPMKNIFKFVRVLLVIDVICHKSHMSPMKKK